MGCGASSGKDDKGVATPRHKSTAEPDSEREPQDARSLSSESGERNHSVVGQHTGRSAGTSSLQSQSPFHQPLPPSRRHSIVDPHGGNWSLPFCGPLPDLVNGQTVTSLEDAQGVRVSSALPSRSKVDYLASWLDKVIAIAEESHGPRWADPQLEASQPRVASGGGAPNTPIRQSLVVSPTTSHLSLADAQGSHSALGPGSPDLVMIFDTEGGRQGTGSMLPQQSGSIAGGFSMSLSTSRTTPLQVGADRSPQASTTRPFDISGGSPRMGPHAAPTIPSPDQSMRLDTAPGGGGGPAAAGGGAGGGPRLGDAFQLTPDSAGTDSPPRPPLPRNATLGPGQLLIAEEMPPA